MTTPDHTQELEQRDILELLRHPGRVFYEYSADSGRLLDRAADEIECLRARWSTNMDAAPKDGTPILATHNRGANGKFWPPYITSWGVGRPHNIPGVSPNYVVNGGKPWWLSPGGKKLAPTPTHWMLITPPEGE